MSLSTVIRSNSTLNAAYEFYNKTFKQYYLASKKSYSQDGEDLIIDSILSSRKKGFFVDVGAYHPIFLSNTYKFYKRGWTGINVDANPLSIAKFKKTRKRDINLNFAVGNSNDPLEYYEYKGDARNTFSKELHLERINNSVDVFLKSYKIKTFPLRDILEENLPKEQEIHFMSIDVEGLEMQVLETNDWNKFRPHHVIIEDLEFSIDNPQNSSVYNFLKSQGYSLTAKSRLCLFFSDQKRS